MFSSNKIAAILAMVATLCFGVLLTLQIIEWNHYRAEPSLWPSAAK